MNRNSNKADIRAVQILLKVVGSKQVLARWTKKKVACHVKCPGFVPAESKILLQAT